MLGTILVGVDGRSGGDDAVALARALSALDDSSLLVVGAYPSLTSSGGRLVWGGIAEEADTRHSLERAKAALGVAANVTYATHPGTTPGMALDDAAEGQAVGLIVIGSSHRSPANRALGGSILSDLLQFASYAVAVAPKGYAQASARRLAKAGLALDGTDASMAAVEFVARLTATLGEPIREVELIHIGAGPGCEGHAHGTSASAATARRRHDDDVLRRACAVLEPRAQVTSRYVDGSPTAALTALSAEVDLLVTGSHRRGVLGRLLFGSVVEGLSQQAGCPVIAVPPGAQASTDAASG